MEKTPLLNIIGYTIENRIVNFLIEGKGIEYTKTDIARGSGIARPTLYKVWPTLVKEGIVKCTKTIGKIKLYTLNEKSEKVQMLLKLEEMLLKKSFEEAEGPKIKTRS